MLATGVAARVGIDGNDGRSEAPIQQQIVSLSNQMITDNAAGGCVNVVEGGSRRVARFEGYSVVVVGGRWSSGLHYHTIIHGKHRQCTH